MKLIVHMELKLLMYGRLFESMLFLSSHDVGCLSFCKLLRNISLLN
jgi:hypothetical protein